MPSNHEQHATTLNYHRISTNPNQQLHGSLRSNPIVNSQNNSGMITSRGYNGGEIKIKYQSPLSTLVEEKQEQRISRTTQPVNAHLSRHPAESSSLHRHYLNHHQSSNSNVNTIKYVKNPQITKTTNSEYSTNINKQGGSSKPSSVNIGGRVY